MPGTNSRIWISFGFVAAAIVLIGCGSGDEAPVVGDNPAAAAGRDVPANMARTGGPPRNTLPDGQGRSGGGGTGADGMATR